MSIRWYCKCGKSLKAPETSAGKRARCPACQKVNVVPAPAAVVEEDLPMIPIEPDDEVVAPPPVPARAPSRAASRVVPPPPVPEEEENDYGREYDLAEETPVTPKGPRLVVRPVAQQASAFGDDETHGEVMAAPAYSRRVAERDDDDDELPLARQGGGGRTWRDFTYLALLLALLPLVLSTLHKDDRPVDLLKRTVANHPEIRDQLAQVSMEDGIDGLFRVLPGHRFDGAMLPRDTVVHWGFAVIAAGAFFGVMMFLFDRGSARAKSLLFTGVFTGTVGIILLLVLQFVAEHTQGWWIRGRSIIVLLFYIIKFIGYSYYAAEDPSNGFAASFFGYTFGVGLCEELVKAIPLIVLVNNLPSGSSWRTACLWGLASGVGFGVAEGIMYSSRYYNGIGGGEIYVVRFVSCVALHAVWAASVAIPLYAFRGEIANAPHIGSTLGTAICLAAPCIILHGLYDTLLKKDYDLYALGVALVSFAYLVGLIEWSQWNEGRPAKGVGRRGFAVA